MNEDDQKKSSELINESGGSEVPDKIELTDPNSLSLEGLLPETKHELHKRVQEKKLELLERRAKSRIDAEAIRDRMSDTASVVKEATIDETHATVTGSYNDDLGRTEVIMGNTDTAQKGKLTRSQRGEKDNTLMYVGIAVGAIIILAIIFGN